MVDLPTRPVFLERIARQILRDALELKDPPKDTYTLIWSKTYVNRPGIAGELFC